MSNESNCREEEASRPSVSMRSTTYAKLYNSALSDAEFLRSLIKDSSSTKNHNNNFSQIIDGTDIKTNATWELEVVQQSSRSRLLSSYNKVTTKKSSEGKDEELQARESVKAVGASHYSRPNNSVNQTVKGKAAPPNSRQIFLRSYKLTRNKSVPEKMLTWVGKVKEKKKENKEKEKKKKGLIRSFSQRMLLCNANVDVASRTTSWDKSRSSSDSVT